MTIVLSKSACRNCRRPIMKLSGIGWVHGELKQYAHEEMTCTDAHPVECTHRTDEHCPLA